MSQASCLHVHAATGHRSTFAFHMSDIQRSQHTYPQEDEDGPVGGMPNTATVAYAGRSR